MAVGSLRYCIGQISRLTICFIDIHAKYNKLCRYAYILILDRTQCVILDRTQCVILDRTQCVIHDRTQCVILDRTQRDLYFFTISVYCGRLIYKWNVRLLIKKYCTNVYYYQQRLSTCVNSHKHFWFPNDSQSLLLCPLAPSLKNI